MSDQEKLKKLEELKKQRDELDKLIAELTQPEPLTTNIPYTPVFMTEFSARPELATSNCSRNDLLQVKLFVNKKCNQISTDYNHTKALVAEILQYKDNKVFIEIFARKLLEQGRVQVSSHLESYKPLSYTLFCLENEEIIKIYASLMVTRPGNDAELRGMYAIYFGYLTLKEDVKACWFWLAGILNCNLKNLSGYILETFLTICGGMLRKKYGIRFVKILRYIKKHFLKELANPPVETRLSNTIVNLEKSEDQR